MLEELIDPACAPTQTGGWRVANLKLQADQVILGASQRSTQDKAGSDNRFRFNFISRYHRGCQGYPVKVVNFNSV
ncbi:hypothetical protein AVDCRST_MAG81-5127 [uncultured Synechococcales cyanobacterium]|uniref:Uncharacterized protein n=1 Tax=uncultured Synechococcales cyanobacterium TaxID=1936017 RepID=A0A6J4VX81_9CYAN|nr:hypothetical protein AVDCRST_MAG81-5127 [uncultured Synechococcales cyanobacterium]